MCVKDCVYAALMDLPTAPLAHRLRPATLDDVVGQRHLLAPGKPLREAVERDALRSILLSGPPGTGKTTLAHVIAATTKANFCQVNAVLSGVKELRAVCAEADDRQRLSGQRTVLFVDEIHRFNTAQQDALLPFVEAGTVVLIGATTENPYFSVNAALVSRSQVFILQPHTDDDLQALLRRAVEHLDGYAGTVTIGDDALLHIAKRANGDARVALNALELAVLLHGSGLSLEQAKQTFRDRSQRYDASAEDHYNAASAFIKTLRGSDVDAALLWMFHMLSCGEEPHFLFRRMLVFAAEDIGLADARALPAVVACWQAFDMVGLPEGEYFLAQACITLAVAPKSNAVKRAMQGAKDALAGASTVEVPLHLRNAPMRGMAAQGYGEGYRYPHDAPDGVVSGAYFPVGMPPQTFYAPSPHGDEAAVGERLGRIRAILRGAQPRIEVLQK